MSENNNRAEKLLNDAVMIRTARAVDDSLRNIESARRLALDQAQDDMAQMREDMIEMQREAVEAQRRLIEQMTELLSFFREFLPNPVQVNVPETRLTLTQQPVTVNVPKAAIEFRPNVTVPEIIIPDRPPPSRALIKHSDGTQSTVEFRTQ